MYIIPTEHEMRETSASPTKDVLCAGGEDDDLCPGGCVAHLHPGVAVLSQLIGQEPVELSLEHTIFDELWGETHTHTHAQ